MLLKMVDRLEGVPLRNCYPRIDPLTHSQFFISNRYSDTVNVTSRMESTGKPGMIQLSKQTADRISSHGKGHWIRPREEKVKAKGKGDLTTFWLQVFANGGHDSSGMHSETEWTEAVEGLENPIQEVGGPLQRTLSQQMMDATATHITEAEKRQRLVEWNADLLIRLLRAVISRRQARRKKPDSWDDIKKIENSFKEREALVMEEVVEVIEMPHFSHYGRDPETLELSETVIQQLKVYVENLSYMYRENVSPSSPECCGIIEYGLFSHLFIPLAYSHSITLNMQAM